ncbi:hypothetical protein SOVF_209990 [Spinacia oleracea]|nr:hypothetical protein SOVF_209990 [Spinacia oleracea]
MCCMKAFVLYSGGHSSASGSLEVTVPFFGRGKCI